MGFTIYEQNFNLQSQRRSVPSHTPAALHVFCPSGEDADLTYPLAQVYVATPLSFVAVTEKVAPARVGG